LKEKGKLLTLFRSPEFEKYNELTSVCRKCFMAAWPSRSHSMTAGAIHWRKQID